ncbi:MAG: glycosyltransferase [bacterium]|nr:glycosyltransferase [bacterium]
MRVLILSLDKTILEKDSAVQRRLLALAEKVGDIAVFVPAERDEKQDLSEHLTVYSFGGAKPIQLWKMWRRAKSLISYPSSLTSGIPQREHHHLASQTRHSSSTEEEKGEEEKKYDLITVQDIYFLGFLGLKLAEKFKIPLEVQVHGFERMTGLRERLARYVLGKATKIRVVSERLKSFLNSVFSIQYSKIYTLPVYTQIEPPQRQMKRKTVPYPFTFLTVGRLVSVKNIGLQIRTFAWLAKEVPHIRLRIVGEGPLEASLKSQVESLKLGEKVTFEGYQKDLSRYYDEADAFLLTSDYEGWGRVALEAAAYTLPIIMTNVGLANEVIHHDQEGIIIPIGDEEHLLGAMREILNSPELRTRLGEAAFKTFKALPIPEEQIQKQIEAWESLKESV